MTSAPQEPCSERLHCMLRPTTKAQLNSAFRRDERFKSEADVVRHLLETYLPAMLNEQPRRRRRSDADVTLSDEPAGPRIGGGHRLPQIRREDVQRRPSLADMARQIADDVERDAADRNALQAGVNRTLENHAATQRGAFPQTVVADGYPDDSPQLPPSGWFTSPAPE